ncbi:MAG: DegV family protein [Fusobacteriaceae bacterium]
MKLEIKFLNSVRLTKLLIAASRWLSKYSDVLNDLNVYPVPDGDTGTNMSMTLQSVENELIKLNHEPKMAELAEIVSEAILLGARGNSGTILSQIIQGFLSGVKDKEEVSVEDVANAFRLAKEKAYEAVIDPVEGTMLTVIRRVAEEAMKYKGPKDDFVLFLIFVKNVAHEAVEDTPNLLPKLKEAGVVDAGGKGIFYILEGFEKSITDPEMLKDLERIVKSQAKRKEKLDMPAMGHKLEEIKFKYCTEFIIEVGNIDLKLYKEKMISYGDSVVCAQTSKKVKTHLHTNNPGAVLEIAVEYGNVSNIKIENMEIQQNHIFYQHHPTEEDYAHEVTEVKEKYMFKDNIVKEKAFYAVSDNEEIGNMFLDNGATAVLFGGQTQNPSVADIEEGLKKINAKKIIILPNNKNIIGAAKLAAERSEKEVLVLETTSMLEGNYVIKNSSETIENILIDKVRNYSIEITQAVRDTKSDDLEISVNDYIALVNGKITNRNSTLVGLIEELYLKYVTVETLNVFAVIGKDASVDGNNAVKKVDSSIKYKEILGEQENYHYYIYVENKNPNMSEIAIVTDSTADLTPELLGDLKVDIIPMKIKLEDSDYYKDGVDITKDEFWDRLLKETTIPKTSQPSPAEFKEVYEKLIEKGYKKIISIHISGKLSGTQQAARVARGMIIGREKDIIVVDSKSVTFGLGYVVVGAAKMAKENKTCEEILTWLENIQEQNKVFFVVNDLKYLVKGGRLGKVSGIVGGLLNLKPILKLEEGEVTVAGKAFGEKGALNFITKLVELEAEKGPVIVNNGWGGKEVEYENSLKLRESLKTIEQVELKDTYKIGVTIGTHSGPVYGVGVVHKI